MFIEFLRNYGPKDTADKFTTGYVNICSMIWIVLYSIGNFIFTPITKMFVYTLTIAVLVILFSVLIVWPILSIFHYWLPSLYMFDNQESAQIGFIIIAYYLLCLSAAMIIKLFIFVKNTKLVKSIMNRFCIKIKIK